MPYTTYALAVPTLGVDRIVGTYGSREEAGADRLRRNLSYGRIVEIDADQVAEMVALAEVTAPA